jgi:hypothetical protein
MWQSPMRLLAAGILVSVGLLVTACGGPATPGVATLSGSNPPRGSGTSTAERAGSESLWHQALEYSKCMRKHGVTNFPNPLAHGHVQIGSGDGIDTNSPAFKAAETACQAYLPKPSPAQIQNLEAQELKFSKCMRAHGVAKFPDPQISTTGKGVRITIDHPKGSLDPNSPTFRSAQKACQKYLDLPKGTHDPPGVHA